MPRHDLIRPRRAARHAIDPQAFETELRDVASHPPRQCPRTPVAELDIRPIELMERCRADDALSRIHDADRADVWREACRVFVMRPLRYEGVLAEE